MLRLILTLMALFTLLAPPQLWGAEPDYLGELKARAKSQGLAEDEAWLKLLHFVPAVWGYKSEADGPDFFLAPSGRSDPQAELVADLAGFLAPPEGYDEKKNPHPQCRFPARFRFLQERLGLDPQRVPVQRCPRFEQWRETLAAHSVTLVYTSEYLNNPASMFAHTFLRLDREGKDSSLVSYAIGYSAHQTTNNPLFYAPMGLLGGFPGTFSTVPYYLKVQEYNSMENRDLWEYSLNLEAGQVERLVMHAWELGSTHFDYYYLDENCSYHILSLLEAAVPGLDLRSKFHLYTAPIDTIHELVAVPGLVGAANFRPSVRRQMQALRGTLSPQLVRAAERLTEGDNPDFSVLEGLEKPQQARALDAAQLLYRYRQGYGLGEAREKVVAAFERRLLFRRARLGAVTYDEPTVAVPARPEESHRSATVKLGAGGGRGLWFSELWMRPVLQDLLARQQGFARDTQIEMGSLRLRLNEDLSPPYPQEFGLLKIVSLTPQEPWIRKLSWRLGLTYGMAPDLPCFGWDCANASIGGGPGVSFRTGLFRDTFYLFSRVQADAGPGLSPWYRLGAGGEAGLLLEPLPRWRLQAEVGYLYHFLGTRTNTWGILPYTAGSNLSLTQNTELRITATWLQDEFVDAVAYFGLYF